MMVTKREWFLVGAVAFFAVMLAMAPVLYGYINAPDGKVLGAVGRDDEYAHWHYVLQAKEGRWLFENRYTLEAHPPIFTLLAELIVGKIAALFGASIIVNFYNLARVVYGFGLLLSIYFFISYFIKEFFTRFLAFLLVCFSSGLGWLWFFPNFLTFLQSHLSYANYTPEAITYSSISASPHITLALILLVLCFYFFIRASSESSIKFLLLSSIFGCLLIQSHPFEAVTLAIIPGVFLFFKSNLKRKDWVYYFIFIFLISLPTLYFLLVSQLNPSYREWTQIEMLSPPFLEILLAFGLLVVFAAWGAKKIFSGKKESWMESEKMKFLVCWAVASFILVKFPFKFQRRLVMGIHLPLSILGSVGMRAILGSGIKKYLLGLFLVLLMLPQNIYITYAWIRQIEKNPAVFYLSNERIESLLWLQKNSDSSEAVFSNPSAGLIIPALSGNRVFLGHWAQTNFGKKKTEQIWDFFKPGTNDEERREFFLENKLDYYYRDKEGINYNLVIFPIEPGYGKKIWELEQEFNPKTKDYFELVFENSAAEIYRIKTGSR